MTEQYFAFIRHGAYHQKKNVPSALQPYALTDEGIKQSEEAAQLIQQFALKVKANIQNTVDSSPLLRAWQTAQVITENINVNSLRVETFPELVERSVGSVANLSTLEIEQLLEMDPRFDPPPKDWKSNSHYCLPFLGAESLMQAGKRVKDHIQQRLLLNTESANSPAQLKLFVGHGAAIRHAAHLMGILAFEEIAQLSMHHAKPVFFKVKASGFEHISGDWKQRHNGSTTEQSSFTD